MADIARATFGVGSQGVVLLQLMLIAVTGWLCSYIASAAGKGQVAGMINTATVFVCIVLVASVAFKAIGTVATFLGL